MTFGSQRARICRISSLRIPALSYEYDSARLRRTHKNAVAAVRAIRTRTLSPFSVIRFSVIRSQIVPLTPFLATHTSLFVRKSFPCHTYAKHGGRGVVAGPLSLLQDRRTPPKVAPASCWRVVDRRFVLGDGLAASPGGRSDVMQVIKLLRRRIV
jgi:hypothetical protein